MNDIKIDFHGGTHGNFLEFVTNVFIMQMSVDNFDIFTSSGSSHNKSLEYHQNKLIRCGHFSTTQKHEVNDDDIIIQISFDNHDDDAYFICLTNLMHRSGDITYLERLDLIMKNVGNDLSKCRNDFYAKINERDNYVPEYTQTYNFKNKIFKFPFDSFFLYPRFCRRLNQLAFFLEETFFPDKTLYQIWEKFIEKNTGWQSWNKCNKILNNILSGIEHPIDDCTELEYAWINYNTAKITRMYQGTSFHDQTFPKSTTIIYNEIQSHLHTLRYE